jgi:hypothetical protein
MQVHKGLLHRQKSTQKKFTVVSLPTKGDVAQIGLVLFVSCHPSGPIQGSITFGKISEKPLATLALATVDDMAHILLVLYALHYPR